MPLSPVVPTLKNALNRVVPVLDRVVPDLGRARVRGTIGFLCWEAAFAIGYETWTGPVFLSGLAGELRIDLSLVAFLIAVPWLAASSQLLGGWIFQGQSSVKRFVLAITGIGRLVWLVPLAAAGAWSYRAHAEQIPFPKNQWFLLTGICSLVASLFTQASANGWMYWMKNLIPGRFHGRFFGFRQRFTTSAFITASLIAAALTAWKPQGYFIGYAVLGFMAVACGMISIYLHSKVPNVPPPATPDSPRRSLREMFEAPLRDQQFRRVLVFGAAFNGSLQLASSYFPYFFTKELGVSMSSIALWVGLANLGCFLAAAFWGRKLDSSRSPYDVLWWTGHGLALSPLVYLFCTRLTVSTVAPFEYLTNGMLWCGFLLAQTTLLLRLSPPRQSASYFSLYAACSGAAGAICSFLGGHLAHLLAPVGGFRALWVIAACSRLLVLWIFCRPLLPASADARAQRLHRQPV